VAAEGDARTLPDELTAYTGYLLAVLGRASQRRFMLAMAEIGVKPAHYGIFTVLDAEGPSPQTRLASALQIDRGQLVGLIDELEAAGLVLRERDPVDRRRQAITLTDAGRERLAEARATCAQLEEELLAPLEPELRAALHGALRRLAGLEDEILPCVAG
jgi:MarR family transcriptional regulator, lower aerobic nicotinate degradation pathway regulator